MLGATIGCCSWQTIFPVWSLYFGTFFGTGEKAVSCRDTKDTKVLTVVCVKPAFGVRPYQGVDQLLGLALKSCSDRWRAQT